MPRLEPALDPFRILWKKAAKSPDRRRIFHLGLEKLRPSIRFIIETQIILGVPPRSIFDFQLMCYADTVGEATVGSQSYKIEPNTALLIPPFVPYSIQFHHTGRKRVICVHFDLAPGFPPLSRRVDLRAPYEVRLCEGIGIPVLLRPDGSNFSYEKCIQMERAWEKQTPLGTLEAETLLGGMIFHILAGHETPRRTDGVFRRSESAVQRVIAHMEKHYGDPLTPTSLAAVGGLSSSHLDRSFRLQTGFAPIRYLNRIRMRAARNLLLQSVLTIKEVAARVGYADPYHFSKAFRQHEGLSPSQFRQNFLS